MQPLVLHPRLMGGRPIVRAYRQVALLAPAISTAWQQLWQRPDLTLDLLGITPTPPYWTQGERYLHTPDTLILLPQSLARHLLALTLGGSRNPGFTSLEHTCLHMACQALSQAIQLPMGHTPQTLTEPYWLTHWHLSSEEGYLGMLTVVCPKAWVRQLPLGFAAPTPEPLPWFAGMQIQVGPLVGKTYLPIDAITHLEVGDLVVLEDSKSTSLRLSTPEGLLRFEIAMPPNVPQYPAQPSDGQPGKGPLWDHLMVEIAAEFEPFLLPLRDVRAMSEGQLVEIDDVAHNTIYLHSQGTRIAQGSLVIIGDKFAVKVDHILGQPLPPTEPTPIAPADMNANAFGQPGEPTSDDELDEAIDSAFEDDEEDTDTEEEQEQW
jgi:hypothetical protein